MAELTVNGARFHAAADWLPLAFMRDGLRQTAATSGRSVGVCGSGTVLVDGKKVKCCKQRVSALVGRSILTVESVQGHMEVGTLMRLGVVLAEDYPTKGGYPRVAFGMLGLIRALTTPNIAVKRVQVRGVSRFYAHGAQEVGKRRLNPTAFAYVHHHFDGRFRNAPPLQDTFGRKGEA